MSAHKIGGIEVLAHGIGYEKMEDIPTFFIAQPLSSASCLDEVPQQHLRSLRLARIVGHFATRIEMLARFLRAVAGR